MHLRPVRERLVNNKSQPSCFFCCCHFPLNMHARALCDVTGRHWHRFELRPLRPPSLSPSFPKIRLQQHAITQRLAPSSLFFHGFYIKCHILQLPPSPSSQWKFQLQDGNWTGQMGRAGEILRRSCSARRKGRGTKGRERGRERGVQKPFACNEAEILSESWIRPLGGDCLLCVCVCAHVSVRNARMTQNRTHRTGYW